MGYLLNLKIKMAILLKTPKLNKDVQMKKLEKIYYDLKNWRETNLFPLQVPNMGAGYVGGEKNEIDTTLTSIKELADSMIEFTKEYRHK
jgi:uncharacterized protein YoxC